MSSTKRFFKLLKIRYRNGVLLISFLAALFGIYTIYSLYQWVEHEFPDVSQLNNQYPHVKYNGPKKPFQIFLKKTPPAYWVRLNQISPAALEAVIMSEDSAFYQHDGVDTNQLKDAIKEDIKKGKFKRGGSTIPMQVIKNVFLTNEKSLYRKAKEILLAVELDKKVSKKKILEVYFNIAEWGEGTFGIQNASYLYFKKPAIELSAKEGAFLAMLLPSPKRYSQSYRSKQLTKYASKTISSILLKMTQAGYLTPEERLSEESKPLSFEKNHEINLPVEPTEENSSSDDSEMNVLPLDNSTQ